MNKSKRIFFLVFILVFVNTISVFANPYASYTANKYGNYTDTLDLYDYVETIDITLESPEDIFIDENDNLYILEDTKLTKIGNNNIPVVILDETELNKANGIFVFENNIYIADQGSKSVKIFTQQGQLLKEITRPTDNLYGSKSTFVPMKVAVNPNGQIFVLSDGNTNGLVQFTPEGEFIGYFGGNLANSNFFQRLKEKVLSGTELGKLIKVTPPSLNNLDIDEKGVVYTATVGNVAEKVKKLNVSSKDIFVQNPLSDDFQNIVDIASNSSYIYMIDGTTGAIIVADKSGKEIGFFGSNTIGTQVAGLFKKPVAIEVDSDKNIYVLDNTLKNIQIFAPTKYMNTIYTATDLYRAGKYDESKVMWEQIISLTPYNTYATSVMGNLERKEEDYDESRAYYYNAYDKAGYSESFWELRQDIMNDYMGTALISVFLLFFVYLAYEKFLQKTTFMNNVRDTGNKIKKVPFINSFIIFTKVLKKPNDTMYEIKRFNTVPVLHSAIILAMGLFAIIVGTYYTSFLMFDGFKEWYIPSQQILYILVIFALYIVSNFLVISIFDGEGKFKHIFTCTVYALAPLFIFIIPVAILSQTLTLSDIFVYNLANALMFGGVFVLLIIKNIEIHNYTFNQSMKIMILTIITMFILLVVLLSMYTLCIQLIIFVLSIIKEVLVRVAS